jgi:glycosyltransferase involved in cell wall biosynthesis
VPAVRRRRVVLLRGDLLRPSELPPWSALRDRYDIAVAVDPGQEAMVADAGLEPLPIRRARALLPPGRPGDLALRAVGERYVGLGRHLRGADVVHAAELGFWFSAQAARLRRRGGFRLALTVWETLPFLDAYRNVRTRPYRRAVLAATDAFLPVTARARDALLVEGAPPERVELCPVGVEVGRFAAAREPRPPADGSHLIVSIGRLVWEKGHQDLLRAVALLHRRGRTDVRVRIVGDGPEEGRLRAVAADLGLAGHVELRSHARYDELPALLAPASCLVLASLPTPYWEEQFGMVLVEAMAAHVPVVAAASGAIPEVVGASGTLFGAGDWVGLADTLAAGPLAGAPGGRRAPDPEHLGHFSSDAAAERLSAVYDRLLA